MPSNIQEIINRLDRFIAQIEHKKSTSTKEYISDSIKGVTDASVEAIDATHDRMTRHTTSIGPRDILTSSPGEIISFDGIFPTRKPEEIKRKLEYKKKKKFALPFILLPAIPFPKFPPIFPLDLDVRINNNHHNTPHNQNRQLDQKKLEEQSEFKINIPWEKIILGMGALSAGMSLSRQEKLHKLTGKLKNTHIRTPVKTHVRPPVSTSVSSGIGGNTTNITTKVDASKLKPKPRTKKPFSGKPTPRQKLIRQRKVQKMKLKGAGRANARFLPLLTLPWLLGKQEVLAGNERSHRDFYKGIVNPGVIAEYNRYLAEEHDWENHPVLSTKRILADLNHDLSEDTTEENRQKYFEHKLQILVDEYMGTWHAERVERETIEAEKQHFRDIQQKDPGDDQVLQNIKAFAKPIVSLIPGPRGALPLDWTDPQVGPLHSILTEQMDITSEDWEEIDIDTRGILLQDAQYRLANPGVRTPMDREALDFYNEKGGTGGWRKKEILEESKKKQQDQDIIDNKISFVAPPEDQLDSLNFRFDIDNNAKDFKAYESDMYASLDSIESRLAAHQQVSLLPPVDITPIVLTDDTLISSSQITDTA